MKYDYLLLGGGLQSGLLVLAIRYHKPSATIAVVERGRALGGNHTWSFHAHDVPAQARAWFDPLIEWRWGGYDVMFRRYRRTLNDAYSTFTGPHLHAIVQASLARARDCALVLGSEVIRADAAGAQLDDGRRLEAQVVIDARGLEQAAAPARTGYQKFIGLEVRLQRRHGLARPLVMDATVPQVDGYHFMYVLPFADDRLLLEDTYFSDRPELETDLVRARIHAWATARGMKIAEEVREERGVLPMPYDPPPASREPPLRAGFAGGWFNPATGYSLPVAVRFADFVSRNDPADLYGTAMARLVAERDRQASFLRLLNRLLFDATPPSSRHHLFERFYRLPEDCIARHYAMQLRPVDQLRILGGTPPKGVSLPRALSALRDALWPTLAPHLPSGWLRHRHGGNHVA